MSNKEFIRSRVFPKALPLGEYKSYSLYGKILRFSPNGIQVVKARTNSKLWIDTTRYQSENKEPLSSVFKEGDEVELIISFNTYINKYEEHSLKIHLINIDGAEPIETYPFEFKDQEFIFDGVLQEAIKTDLPNVYIIKVARLEETGEEKEIYNLRYSVPEGEPTPGTYEVVFTVKNTPNIINMKGELFSLREKYEKDVEGNKEVRTSKVFIPCLQVRALYPQPRTKS